MVMQNEFMNAIIANMTKMFQKLTTSIVNNKTHVETKDNTNVMKNPPPTVNLPAGKQMPDMNRNMMPQNVNNHVHNQIEMPALQHAYIPQWVGHPQGVHPPRRGLPPPYDSVNQQYGMPPQQVQNPQWANYQRN